MAEFNMKIAGLTVRIQTQFESTTAYCRNYITDDEPQFHAVITPEDRQREQLESWE